MTMTGQCPEIVKGEMVVVVWGDPLEGGEGGKEIGMPDGDIAAEQEERGGRERVMSGEGMGQKYRRHGREEDEGHHSSRRATQAQF